MEARQTLLVPGTLEGVRLAADGFDAFSATHGLSKGEVWPFQVVIDEILSNLVHHGFPEQSSRTAIEIEIQLQDREIVLSIVDDAPAFNPLEVPPPNYELPLEERPIGGLGIALVTKLMDYVEYERRGDRNRLRLRRRLMEV